MKIRALVGLALAGALMGWGFACAQNASHPIRPDATPDAEWTTAYVPATFDAGSGSGGY